MLCALVSIKLSSLTMASLVTEIEQDTLDAIQVKQPSSNEDQYKKVLDRPYITPTLVDHASACAGNGEEETQTSRNDCNFDEKDYKSRRKASTHYHAPLRRITSVRRNESRDKSSKRHKKKHKKDHQREVRLQELVNHEEEKAKSRERSGSRRSGVVSKMPEEGQNDQVNESTDFASETFEETSLDTTVEEKDERVPSLASREDDAIEVEPIRCSPGSPYCERKNQLQTNKLKEVKIDMPVDDEDIAMPSLSSMGDIAVPNLSSVEGIAVPRLSPVEGIAVPRLSSVEGIAVPRLSSVEGIAVPRLSPVEGIAVPRLSSVEGIAVPRLSSVEGIAVPRLSPVEGIAVPRLSSVEGIAVPRLSSVEGIAVPRLSSVEGIAVPRLSSMEDGNVKEEEEPLISFAERENEKQLLTHQVNGNEEAKIDIPDGNEIPRLPSKDDMTLANTETLPPVGTEESEKKKKKKAKEQNAEDEEEDVGLQMEQIRRDGELPTGKQLRKFTSKDRRDSFVDILPKIHEHSESDEEPVRMVVSDYEAVKEDKASDEEDFDANQQERDKRDPDAIPMGRKRHHHRKRHRKHEMKQHRTISEREALAERSRLRSGLLTLQETENSERGGLILGDEADMLEKKDLEQIAWHRFEDLRGFRRRRPHHRKPRLKSGTLTRQSSTDTIAASTLHFPVKYDHSPHEAFIELQELTPKEGGFLWKETARWIKFEEDVEASNRWGRPHVASLTFQSLLELRKGLEKGTVLLDLEQFDIHSIVETIVENMVITDQLPRSDKNVIVDALLLKHRHQYQDEASYLSRRSSLANLMSFAQNSPKDDEIKFPKEPKIVANEEVIRLNIDDDAASDYSDLDDPLKSQVPLYIPDSEENRAPKREVTFAPPNSDEKPVFKESNVKSRIPADAEATAVMVGALKELKSPVLAFVRIAKGCYLEGLTEVNIPCRFIFIMLGPLDNNDTYYEIGRSISTLMTDQVFHDLAYYSESRQDLLQAINEFLDDTIVLPPGEWDRQLLIPLLMGQSKVMAKRRKVAKEINAIAAAAAEEQEGPLQRTGRYGGGLVRDIKRRAECYISDFKDGLNLHCLWVTLFLYFAVFAPNIAFGGLLADKTDNWLGVSEVIFSSCLCGILFGLLSGQPLMIIAATGPVLVFEQSIYQFCDQFKIEFLPWRFWIGLWVMIILLIVVIFEGCFLVRYFTRFTEEVFGCLISAIFIYEAIHYLYKVFKTNPLVRNASNNPLVRNVSNGTAVTVKSVLVIMEPNTALMSVILLFGTFFVAFYMQKVRHSHFFGKQVRRLISDLGIVTAMAIMTMLDLVVGDKVVIDKVSFVNPFEGGFRPTNYKERGWVINPIGLKDTIQPGWIFAAVVPALFIGILLFMETEMTGVLLNKKENNLQKLPGFNIDLLVMGFITFICGIFGLPWMCAATVRSISHFTALSVWSTSHAPGERPFLIEVKEQRVTNIAIHVLIGISIILAPINHIPVPVLFGVLLYLGVASLGHIQLVNRMVMLFMPPKHHPDVRYVRKVRTNKIYWFTAVQIVCLIILVIVKLTVVAPAFPFFIMCLIPVRRLLSKFFTTEDLEELDNEEGEESEDDDLDMLMHS